MTGVRMQMASTHGPWKYNWYRSRRMIHAGCWSSIGGDWCRSGLVRIIEMARIADHHDRDPSIPTITKYLIDSIRTVHCLINEGRRTDCDRIDGLPIMDWWIVIDAESSIDRLIVFTIYRSVAGIVSFMMARLQRSVIMLMSINTGSNHDGKSTDWMDHKNAGLITINPIGTLVIMIDPHSKSLWLKSSWSTTSLHSHNRSIDTYHFKIASTILICNNLALPIIATDLHLHSPDWCMIDIVMVGSHLVSINKTTDLHRCHHDRSQSLPTWLIGILTISWSNLYYWSRSTSWSIPSTSWWCNERCDPHVTMVQSTHHEDRFTCHGSYHL